MGFLRLFFGAFFLVIGLFGYMAFDFTMANRSLVANGGEPMGFAAYLNGLTGFTAAWTRATAAPGVDPMPDTLVAMLPRAPEGWSTRPAEEADAQGFLAEGTGPDATALITAVTRPEDGKGVQRVAQVFQNGPSLVVVELVRYPDLIFTSFMAMAEKTKLQMLTWEIPGTPFMTVRGLEMREADLRGDVPARVFLADVGAQIHIKVLAPKTMSDQDLLPFFETLHVQAMNADVVGKVAGLGEVPVIVLASAITEETRRAAEEERAAAEVRARDAAAAAEAAAARAAAEAAAPAAAEGEAEPEQAGVTVNKGISGETGGSTLKMGGGLPGDNCQSVSGSKTCGSLGD